MKSTNLHHHHHHDGTSDLVSSASPSIPRKKTTTDSPVLGKKENEEELKQREISLAAAILSIGGPCRQMGDIYLACVATSGLGQCRQWRAEFERCSKATAESSKAMLQGIADQYCSHLVVDHQVQVHHHHDGDNDEKLLCAAQLVNRQLLGQPQKEQPPQKEQQQQPPPQQQRK